MKNKYQAPAPMDERQKLISLKAGIWGYATLGLCMLIKGACDIVSTGEAGWELFAVILSVLVIFIARNLMGDVEPPLDIWNRPMPTGMDKASRIHRVKNYLLDALFFAGIFTVFDFGFFYFGTTAEEVELTAALFPALTKLEAVFVTMGISFAAMFFISLLFDYLVCEFFKVRRYNKFMAKLDEEE